MKLHYCQSGLSRLIVYYYYYYYYCKQAFVCSVIFILFNGIEFKHAVVLVRITLFCFCNIYINIIYYIKLLFLSYCTRNMNTIHLFSNQYIIFIMVLFL